MEIIHGGRGSGKTTKVIQKIKESGGILIVASYGRKQQLVDAGCLTADQIYTFQERTSLCGTHCRYYIDDMESLLQSLFGTSNTCVGFTADEIKAIPVNFMGGDM